MTRVSRGLILLSKQAKLTARWQQTPRCLWLSNQSLREFHSTETAVNNHGSYISESPKAQTVSISKEMSVNDRYADCWFNHSTTYVCHYIPLCHINIYNYYLKLKRKCEGEQPFSRVDTEAIDRETLTFASLSTAWGSLSWFINQGKIKRMNKFKGEINSSLICHIFFFLPGTTHISFTKT